MKFESLTLTPFCMEILGVGTCWMFQCLGSVLVRFWLESGKNMSTFFIFFKILLQIFPVFFLQGEINCCGGRHRKCISPLHDFWIAGVDISI